MEIVEPGAIPVPGVLRPKLPPKQKLRPPVYGSIGQAVGDIRHVNIQDPPTMALILPEEIQITPGARPQIEIIQANGGPTVNIPIFYSDTEGLYFDLDTFNPQPGDQVILPALSPPFWGLARPIRGHAYTMPEE